MKILALGDSWTYGSESSDPETMSWPAQMARKYGASVTNLARGGSSNQRAIRIGMEELCRNNDYNWVVLPLGPANRTEILKTGKWHQIWPGFGSSSIDRIFTEFWHPWNDMQMTMQLCLYFLSLVELLGPKLYITGLSLRPSQYQKELSWILDYKNDCDFESLGMPLQEFNIAIKDLDRKLRALRAMHETICQHQPKYLNDVVKNYLQSNDVRKKHGSMFAAGGHPNDQGYLALADYFAQELGL